MRCYRRVTAGYRLLHACYALLRAVTRLLHAVTGSYAPVTRCYARLLRAVTGIHFSTSPPPPLPRSKSEAVKHSSPSRPPSFSGGAKVKLRETLRDAAPTGSDRLAPTGSREE